MFDSFGLEILVQPFLYLVAAVAVLVVYFKGSHRPLLDVDGVTRKGKRQYVEGAGKRAVIGLVAAAVLLPGLVITPPGHRAAIYDLGGGVSPVERGEGLSLVIPWVQSARMVNVRTLVYEVEVYPQSLDLQEVTVPVAVNYHIQPDQAAELYQAVGLNYQQTVIAPAVLQLVTQSVGQFAAIDFAANRAALAEKVRVALEGRLAPYGIVVESINVKDAIFAKNFLAAVEAKIIADQKASEQERLVDAAKHTADQVIATAKGAAQARIEVAKAEREAIEEVAAALGFTPVEYLEWTRLQRWDGILPKTYLSGSGSDLIFDVGAE